MAGPGDPFISSTSNYILSLEIAFWTDRDACGKDRHWGQDRVHNGDKQLGGRKREEWEHSVGNGSLDMDVADGSSYVT